MKHTWLVGILAGALLAGSAAVQAQQKPAAQCPPERWHSARSRSPGSDGGWQTPSEVAATRCASQRRRHNRRLLVSYPT